MPKPALLAFTVTLLSLLPCYPDDQPPPPPTVVQLTLKGAFEDALAQENPFGPSPLHFRGLLETIRKAANDSNVAAVYLKCESPALGLAKVREVLAALKELKASGKKIYAYAEQPSTLDLMLLSAASRIEMPESAMALLPGVSAEVMYMKPLFDRIGLRFLVTHIGDYKSAFENYARREMSPAYREVLESLVESRYQAILDVISEGRSIPRENVAEALDRGFLSAAELKDLGIIDEVAHRDHFWDDVKADLGADKIKLLTNYGRRSVDLDTQNPFVLFKMLMEAFSPQKKRSSTSPKIAIVYASGMILTGKSQTSPFGGGTVMGSETMVDAIKTAGDDPTVKAIVLRIDSPGGSGIASDAIWKAVCEAKAKKPVVASMSDVAASGGYYIAMGASRVIAQPDTVTGSIGVVSAFVNLSGTMDLLGIKVERVSRGKSAGSFSPFTDPDQVSMEPMRKLMESFYWQFVEKAAQGRGKTRDEIHAVAQGRVWTGSDAVKNGLVDELGGLRRAVEVARELAAIPADEKLDTIELPPAPNIFEALSETFGMARVRGMDQAARLACLAQGLGLSGRSTSPELDTLMAVPELRGALARAALLLQVARDRTVLLMPVEVRVR